jgi:hypothetical protein
MLRDPPLRPHTLIIRVWPEPRELEGRDGEWRGEVRQVSTGETVFFRGLDALCPLVRRMIESEEP